MRRSAAFFILLPASLAGPVPRAGAAQDCRESLPRLEAAAKSKPDDFAAWLTLGRCRLQLGSLPKAEEALSKALEGRDWEAHALLGDLYMRQKKWSDAERLYLRAQSLDESRPEVLLKLADAQIALQKPDQAIETLRKAREKAPRSRVVLDKLGALFERTGNRYEARAVYLDRFKDLGAEPGIVSKLCQLYSEDGYMAETERFCKQGMRRDPRQPANYLYLAKSLASGGDRAQAIEWLRRGTGRFPKDGLLRRELGRLHADEKDWEIACAHYQAAFERMPKDEEAAMGLGRVAFQLGRHEKALEAFRRALELNRVKHAVEVRRSAGILRSKGDGPNSRKYEKLLLEFDL